MQKSSTAKKCAFIFASPAWHSPVRTKNKLFQCGLSNISVASNEKPAKLFQFKHVIKWLQTLGETQSTSLLMSQLCFFCFIFRCCKGHSQKQPIIIKFVSPVAILLFPEPWGSAAKKFIFCLFFSWFWFSPLLSHSLVYKFEHILTIPARNNKIETKCRMQSDFETNYCLIATFKETQKLTNVPFSLNFKTQWELWRFITMRGPGICGGCEQLTSIVRLREQPVRH